MLKRFKREIKWRESILLVVILVNCSSHFQIPLVVAWKVLQPLRSLLKLNNRFHRFQLQSQLKWRLSLNYLKKCRTKILKVYYHQQLNNLLLNKDKMLSRKPWLWPKLRESNQLPLSQLQISSPQPLRQPNFPKLLMELRPSPDSLEAPVHSLTPFLEWPTCRKTWKRNQHRQRKKKKRVMNHYKQRS